MTQKRPKNNAHHRDGDMSQGMGYVTGRDPLPTLGSRPVGSPPEKRLPTSA